MKYQNKTYKIIGMSCTGCEEVIENALKKVNGITEVRASFKSASLTVSFNKELVNERDIKEVINSVGYDFKTEDDKYTILSIIIIMLIAYVFLKDTGIFSNIPVINSNIDLGLLFIVGLLTSVHCIFMCGGINMAAISTKKYKKFYTSGLLYNLGRLVSYTLIGGFVGLIGSVLAVSNQARDIINIIVGAVMVLMGLKMVGVIKFKTLKYKFKISKKISSPFTIGLLNGFMPCGPLQAMQMYALTTGSFFRGALSMFLFSLGTIPLMLFFSVVSSFLTGKKSVVLKQISALLLVFLGIVMLTRSLDLSFIGKGTRQKEAVSSVLVDNHQVVKTRFTRGKYVPIKVVKNVPVRWEITIEKGDLNGCNNEIYIPEYGINKKLEYGKNIIEFTPTDTGDFKYACWMNMIKNEIYVVEK